MATILVKYKKPEWGMMMQSMIIAGAEVVELGEDLTKYDDLLWFASSPPPVKCGWWMCDLRDPKMMDRIDTKAIFLCNKEYIKDYKEHFDCPVHYMPQCGYDAPIEKGREVKSDIVFIGGMTSGFHINRSEYVKAIKGYNLLHIKNERFTKDQKYIYKNTPISLAISPQAEGYTSNRLYNILSSQGFCLTLYFPGIEDLFENKKHLVWFKNKEEMLELIDYYLKHKKERDAIALNGYKEYQKKHTAKHRLTNIFKILYDTN